MKFNELKDGKEYYAKAMDGKEYKGTFVNKYFPGGVFYSVHPMFLSDGKTENKLISFRPA